MLTDEEIERMALDMESDRVERKESLSGKSKDKIAQAVCAYSNDLPNHRAPGIILVGVRDSGECTGLAITDELLLNLGGLRSDGNILPLPTIAVRKISLKGTDVAVAIVMPSPDTPVRYDGRVWIRVGPRRAVASRDEERILIEKRQAGDLPFDRQPAALPRDSGFSDSCKDSDGASPPLVYFVVPTATRNPNFSSRRQRYSLR